MKTQLKQVTMYNEVKNLFKDCKSISAISRKSGHDRKTVRKYLSMSEENLESYMEEVKHRRQKLSAYESYALERVKGDPECSAAQIEDWLKEKYPDLPVVSSRTVYNFVRRIRNKYHLPKQKIVPRQYEAVEELPYGKQGQVDFGESWMIDINGNRVKVFFMVMSLSRSRDRFVCFTNQPVTTWFVIRAHEEAFGFFEGIPQEIVYDQDSTILVNENSGELIYTRAFEEYVLHAGFSVFMCHKADPESKGKIENNVKYVKWNFLQGRVFTTLDNLNQEALEWLKRTANAKVHSTTRLIPHQEWLIERSSLKPFVPILQEPNPGVPYGVRKNNTILFRGNRYALPRGTYQGPDSQVCLKINDDTIVVSQMDGTMIETFRIETQKGKLIKNKSRKRDTSLKVVQIEEELYNMFSDTEQASLFLTGIRERFPRYIRDQYSRILSVVRHQNQHIIDETLSYCISHSLISGSDFANVFNGLNRQLNASRENPLKEFKPMATAINMDAILSIAPQRSNIDDYQNLLNPAPWNR